MSISVCMTTYNGEKYIKEQLDSILCQLGEDDEVIISDDSSTDQTVNIIKSYNDKRIKLFEEQKFFSPTYNFENSLKYATKDFIFLSDQDDVWLPAKVATVLKYLKEHDLVVSDCIVVDEDLKVLDESFFGLVNSGNGFFKNFVKNTYIGCCMAFRRSVLEYILPFPSKIAMHDIWIGLSTEMKGTVFFLKEPQILYRRHENTATLSGLKSKNNTVFKLYYRFLLLYQLVKRHIFNS
jgi:glycosyltransferase involved in cell wall biosynthesis